MQLSFINFFKNLSLKFNRIIEGLLVITVILILVLALISILSRWFQITNLWIEPLNRHLVLLLVFLGATVAVDRKKHLKVDALSITFETKIGPKILHIIELIFVLLTGIVVCFLFKSGIQFWKNELEFPVDAFLGLSQYHLAFVIPLGFFMLLVQYIFLLTNSTLNIFIKNENK